MSGRAIKGVLAGLVLAVWPVVGLAQGFAGLGTAVDGFERPDPDYELRFPSDHAAHPGFRVEWWYVTANLSDADGNAYGLQWTLFRTAPSSEADATPIWLGHAAVTTEADHFATERWAMGGTGQAGVSQPPVEAWIDEWVLTDFGADEMTLRAGGSDFAFDMTMEEVGPIVLQGDDGFSVKSQDGRASHYYSLPFLDISGVLTFADREVAVSGHAWIDREWSSQPLAEDQTGWDWFSLAFDDGSRLMGFQLRGGDVFTAGTLISADGEARPLPDGAFEARPIERHEVAGRDVPVVWGVTVAEAGIDVTVEAVNREAWMPLTVPYWEGPVRVSGSHEGSGYLEMTGYPEQ